jgi:hypothetical protein
MEIKENGGKCPSTASTVYEIKSAQSIQKQGHDVVNSVCAFIGCDCSLHTKAATQGSEMDPT